MRRAVLDCVKFRELLIAIAPTPDDRTEIARRVGIGPWAYGSKTDWLDLMEDLVTVSEEPDAD